MQSVRPTSKPSVPRISRARNAREWLADYAGAQQAPLALLLVGIKDLKQINERLGRERGDAVIRKAGAKITAFAGVHIFDDDEFVDVLQHLFAGTEKLGDDAGDLAARAEHGFSDFAHQTETAAAVDQTNISLGERLAEFTCGDGVGRVQAAARAAVDANAINGTADCG